jgi:hypothetical protein
MLRRLKLLTKTMLVGVGIILAVTMFPVFLMLAVLYGAAMIIGLLI